MGDGLVWITFPTVCPHMALQIITNICTDVIGVMSGRYVEPIENDYPRNAKYVDLGPQPYLILVKPLVSRLSGDCTGGPLTPNAAKVSV